MPDLASSERERGWVRFEQADFEGFGSPQTLGNGEKIIKGGHGGFQGFRGAVIRVLPEFFI